MTRAERYKRNYGLIRNAYQNSVLAKRGQTWSDEKIFKELGIIVTSKETPTLKKIDSSRQSYFNRKLDKFIYARSIGIEVADAKKLTGSKKSKIDSSREFYDARSKRFNIQNKRRRMDLWSEWSSHPRGSDRGNFPPAIERAARERNRLTEVAGKQLDDHAHYGYVVEFYKFVENKQFNEIKDLVQPDPHDALRVRYETTVRA